MTIPLLMPSLLSAALIVFVTSAGLFDVPLALAATRGIRTMPTEIFHSVHYPWDFGRAAAFGVLITAATIALTLRQRRCLSKRRFEIVRGKGYRPRLIRLRWRARVAALALDVLEIVRQCRATRLAMSWWRFRRSGPAVSIRRR